MILEPRENGGYPSVVLIPQNQEEARLIDRFLGDCGGGPIQIVGVVKMADGYGPSYIWLRNPALNPHPGPREEA